MPDPDTFALGLWWGLSLFAVWHISGGYHYKKGLDHAYEDANKAVNELFNKLRRMGVIK